MLWGALGFRKELTSIKTRDSKVTTEHTQVLGVAVGFPDANYEKVSGGDSLVQQLLSGKKEKTFSFFFVRKERVITFKNVNNALIKSIRMEMRGST